MKLGTENLILINANVFTFDPLFKKADWVVIEHDKFAAIGYGKDWNDWRKKGSKIINYRGKTVLPGFSDAHLHFVAYAKRFVTLNLGPGTDIYTISDIQTRIRDRALRTPSGKWILGNGYNEFYLAEKRHPDRRDLDKASAEHPVRLTHRSGHAHVLNSLALKHVGITKETGDPDGSIIERDLITGEPTGLLWEMGAFLSDRIPALTPAELGKGVQMANQELISMGITSIQDASSGNDGDNWKRFKSWKKSGLLKPRVNMMLGFQTFEKNNHLGLSTDLNVNQLRFNTVKIILDDTTGRLHPVQTELNRMVHAVHNAGLQVAIHALEENAIEAACQAIKYSLDKTPRDDHRHRIEHGSVCPPHLAKQIAALGIMVVTQPSFIHYNGERYLKTVAHDRLKHLYPLKTFLNYGISVAGSSDCPIVPPNPLIGIFAAISRMADTGDPVGEEQKISPPEALQMYTQSGARASFEETIKGTITPGKLADLVVLNGDPTRLAPNEMKHLQVEKTMIGGEVVWEKNCT
jgi:predicted amidohydrolase YtcJ